MLMNRLWLNLLLPLCLWLCSQPVRAQKGNAAQNRPRVGLVLSGGGAKGAAHIGVIRAVEQAGIPIDYIAGTSMGAIVGGLYAMGYTTDELEQLVKMQDWEMLLSDKSPRKQLSPEQRERKGRYILNIPLSRSAKPKMDGFVRGRNLGNMLARLTVGYHDSISFDSLHIPFACVATNLANGDEVVLRSGKLSAAIRASMAIPGVFTPVVMEGKTLVDGGLCNNFPVDVARRHRLHRAARVQRHHAARRHTKRGAAAHQHFEPTKIRRKHTALQPAHRREPQGRVDHGLQSRKVRHHDSPWLRNSPSTSTHSSANSPCHRRTFSLRPQAAFSRSNARCFFRPASCRYIVQPPLGSLGIGLA